MNILWLVHQSFLPKFKLFLQNEFSTFWRNPSGFQSVLPGLLTLVALENRLSSLECSNASTNAQPFCSSLPVPVLVSFSALGGLSSGGSQSPRLPVTHARNTFGKQKRRWLTPECFHEEVTYSWMLPRGGDLLLLTSILKLSYFKYLIQETCLRRET